MNKHTKLLFGLVLGLGFCLIFLPTNATSSYIHEKTIDGTGTITICDPTSNGTKCITMMDRNLGATTNDILSTGSYGYQYQWGNNHGFLPCTGGEWCGDFPGGEHSVPNERVNTSNYGYGAVSGYYDSDTYIMINTTPYDRANPRNHNLWGGSGDSAGNNWGYNKTGMVATNVTGRQGPCPQGYHVPSRGEREYLIGLWSQNKVNGERFQDDFKLPLAGVRFGTTELRFIGQYLLIRSSSPIARNDGSVYDLFVEANDSKSASDVGYRADSLSVRCFKNYALSFPYVETTDDENFTITLGNETYTELPEEMVVTINNDVNLDEDKPVVGEVSVDFGEDVSAKFNKLVQVNVPAPNEKKVIIKVKHAQSDEYNYDGLTTNANANCDNNGGIVNSTDRYNGEIIDVIDGYASIYTCEASSFIALGLGKNIGEVTLTLIAGENTCTLNDYNLGIHNVSSEDQNVSTLGQDIVCEFLKNPGATIQLSMGDLADGTKTIGHQYFTGIVTSLGNPLGSIANLTGGSYNFLSSHVIYTKEANTIGTWTGSLAIEGIIPAGTPSGEYTGELNIIICEGC